MTTNAMVLVKMQSSDLIKSIIFLSDMHLGAKLYFQEGEDQEGESRMMQGAASRCNSELIIVSYLFVVT
jgi:hypothetical protein